MRISLCGAAREVTGSGYLVETAKARVLVDFEMFQGSRATEARNWGLSPVDPLSVDAIVATHAHDHTGRLPLLPSRGFRGPIHATPATVDFAQVIRIDSARLQQASAARQSRRLLRAGKEAIAPLYGLPDVEALSPLFSPLPCDERREIAEGIEVGLVDAGHILGSSSVEMTVREQGRERVVIFSGDVGLRGSSILRDPTPLYHTDLVFLESTYGDRDHRSQDETVQEFHEILARAVRERVKVLSRRSPSAARRRFSIALLSRCMEGGSPTSPSTSTARWRSPRPSSYGPSATTSRSVERRDGGTCHHIPISNQMDMLDLHSMLNRACPAGHSENFLFLI